MIVALLIFGLALADDLDREGLAAATAVAASQSANELLAAGGKKPTCPPRSNDNANRGLSNYDRDECPGAIDYKPKAFPVQGIIAASGHRIPVSVVGEADLVTIFEQYKKLNLPWGNARWCVQRSFIGGYCLHHAMRIETAKIIVEPGTLGGHLSSKCGLGAGVVWNQHQALIVLVTQKDGTTRPFVLDPSMNKQKALAQTEWESCLTGAGSYTVGVPNARSSAEAAMDSPPAFNADGAHDIDANWHADFHR